MFGFLWSTGSNLIYNIFTSCSALEDVSGSVITISPFMVVLSIVNRLWYLGDIWSLTVQSVAAVAPHDDVHLPHSHVTL